MTTTTHTERTGTSLAAPGRLLVASLPGFVAYIVFAIVSLHDTIETTTADLTPAQVDDISGRWLIAAMLWAAPLIAGAMGLITVARRVRRPASPGSCRGWSAS